MREKKFAVISGGTGSSKLIRGFKEISRDFYVIVNVADNFWFHSLYVCPDLDITCYSLADISDKRRGWGLEGDTFNMVEQIGRLGFESWFKLGDRDAALSIVRTKLLKEGLSLTEVTSIISKALGIRQRVLPASDIHYETHVVTPQGEMHLQEFWVKFSGKPDVLDVVYRGIKAARLSEDAKRAILNAERIVICPANPVTSIMTILSLPEIKHIWTKSRAKKIAVSPIVGNRPFSGPACKFMKAKGFGCSSLDVARMYSGLVDTMVLHLEDSHLCREIEAMGMRCEATNTEISAVTSAAKLAERLLEI